MDWVLLATGVTGGWTLIFALRWLHRRFGTPPHIAVYHSPKGGCTDAVVQEIHKARKEVLVQAYSFTSKPIAQALIEAKKRGVHVEVLLDKSNEHETYTELDLLKEQGIAPRIDAQHAIAHNKIMLIDRKIVITGSFNFTHQAEAENAENLLIIKGHPELANSYHLSFLTHKEHSQQPGSEKSHPTESHRKAA